MRWHFVFIILYLSTFVVGWLRTMHVLFYRAHPILGISSVVIPFVVYLFSKNKKLIRQLIKSNFKLNGRPKIILAKISTLVIIFYYLFSIATGFMLNNGLYGTAEVYQVSSAVHGASKVIVPVAVGTHVFARLSLKRKRI